MKLKALALAVTLIAAFAATPSQAIDSTCVVQCDSGAWGYVSGGSQVDCQNLAGAICDCRGGNWTYTGPIPPPSRTMRLQETC